MAQYDPDATCRVPLEFGDDDISKRAQYALPPHYLIPTIFVPGIMGRSLDAKPTDTPNHKLKEE